MMTEIAPGQFGKEFVDLDFQSWYLLCGYRGSVSDLPRADLAKPQMRRRARGRRSIIFLILVHLAHHQFFVFYKGQDFPTHRVVLGIFVIAKGGEFVFAALERIEFGFVRLLLLNQRRISLGLEYVIDMSIDSAGQHDLAFAVQVHAIADASTSFLACNVGAWSDNLAESQHRLKCLCVENIDDLVLVGDSVEYCRAG